MDKDAGTIAALMIRFKEYRLPRAKRLLEKVNEGNILSDEDIDWLENIFEESKSIQPLIKRNPEYKTLVVRTIDLYSSIVTKAVENEKALKS